MSTSQTMEVVVESASESTLVSGAGSSTSMAIQVTKRRLVDLDGSEIQDPKRARAEPDLNAKGDAFGLILHWHEYLVREFQIEEFDNIDLICDVTSILWTAHTKFRQDANNVGSMKDRITDDFPFVVGVIEVKWSRIKGTLKGLALKYNFKYGPTQEDKSRIGTLGSILGLMVSYRPRYNEVRTGTNRITLKKTGDVVNQIPIEQFGLSSRHSILMKGCTYNPTLQSSMKNSLGPMTIAINLCMQRERLYQKAWKQAFINAFKLFPYAHEIADLLAGSGKDKDALLRQLGDIALWNCTRSSNKAAFPVSMFLVVARTNPIYADFFKDQLPNTTIRAEMIPNAIKGIDFSGIGAYRFWNEVCKHSFKIRRSPSMKKETAMESTFHAVWGTHTEDLGILQWMTEHTFQTRRQMGNQFQGRNERETTYHSIKMITFKRITKLASACQTDFLSGSKGQISRGAVFSGKVNTRVSIEDELYKTLIEAQGEINEGSRDIAKIMSRLQKVKESIRLKMDATMSYVEGTTKFYVPTDYLDYGRLVEEIPMTSKKYFYNNEN